jgi:hypothetical protein
VIVELVLAGLFLLFGLVSGFNSLRDVEPVEEVRIRFLIALHDTAKAGFWLSLGGYFLGLALIGDPRAFRWFVLMPIVMAGLRLATAAFLARS